jgi:hypothetical protein
MFEVSDGHEDPFLRIVGAFPLHALIGYRIFYCAHHYHFGAAGILDIGQRWQNYYSASIFLGCFGVWPCANKPATMAAREATAFSKMPSPTYR